MEVTFRKQVARKGSSDAGRLSLLLDALAVVAPYDDPLAAGRISGLAAFAGRPPRRAGYAAGQGGPGLRPGEPDRTGGKTMPRPAPLPYERLAPRNLSLTLPAHDRPAAAPCFSTSAHLSCLLAATRLARRYQDIFPQYPEWLQETFDWQAADAGKCSLA